MRVLAIIPARGGSKGIPKKNIIHIRGVSLIARTVKTVKRCQLVDTILVSTDDNEIAEIARKHGAEIIERPAELAGDRVSTEAVMLHACKTWSKKTGEKYDLILLAQNTSPLHHPEDMEKVINMVQSGKFNSCIAAVVTHKYFWLKKQNGWEMPFQTRGPRQQRDFWYEEAGSLYCVRYESFCKDGNLFPKPVGVIEVPWWRGFEIDEPVDIMFAELLCQNYEVASNER